MASLSVAASIIHILAASRKIVEIVQPFVANANDAPNTAVLIHEEVSRIQSILKSLKQLLQDISSQDGDQLKARATYLQIDSIIAMFTEGMLVFADLENTLARFRRFDDMAGHFEIPNRLAWVRQESEMTGILERMERFQISLTASLTILQCGSESVAQESKRILDAQMYALLAGSETVAARLSTVEDTFNATTQLERGPRLRRRSTLPRCPSPSRKLWTALKNPREYRRAKSQQRLQSQPKASSVFAGLSLGNVPNISTIPVPVYSADLPPVLPDVMEKRKLARQDSLMNADRPKVTMETIAESSRPASFVGTINIEQADYYEFRTFQHCKCPMAWWLHRPRGQPLLAGAFFGPQTHDGFQRNQCVQMCVYDGHISAFSICKADPGDIKDSQSVLSLKSTSGSGSAKYTNIMKTETRTIKDVVKTISQMPGDEVPSFTVEIRRNWAHRSKPVFLRFPSELIMNEWVAAIEKQLGKNKRNSISCSKDSIHSGDWALDEETVDTQLTPRHPSRTQTTPF